MPLACDHVVVYCNNLRAGWPLWKDRFVTELELIVAALAAGAAAGAGNTATTLVQDAYAGLKSLVTSRFAAQGQAVEVLEADQAEPEVWQARVGEALAASGAAGDEQVQAAARRLLELVDPVGERAGRYQVTVTNNYGQSGSFHAPATINYGQVPIPPAPPAAL